MSDRQIVEDLYYAHNIKCDVRTVSIIRAALVRCPNCGCEFLPRVPVDVAPKGPKGEVA